MAEQNYTVFQRLGKLFSGSQGGSPVSDPTPTYNFDKKSYLELRTLPSLKEKSYKHNKHYT